MRLFIFEGPAEDNLFYTIRKLFFGQSDDDVCIYRSNIYSLYSKMKDYEIFGEGHYGDTLTIMNEILVAKGDNTLSKIIRAGKDVSEVFLFFDYDFQENRLSLDENNVHLKEMLEYFTDETENGKLFISYPMLEAYRHIKSLPDENFITYMIKREECSTFKKRVNSLSPLQIQHFAITEAEINKKGFFETHASKWKQRWLQLVPMNVKKANLICNDSYELPQNKYKINQKNIFEGQLKKYVNVVPCSVSILSAIPLFLYDYLREEDLNIE